MRVRTTKTGSLSTAVQVVRYEYGRTVVVKHFGSSKDPEEILRLKRVAFDWITSATHQQSFFSKEPTFDPLFTRYQYLGVKHNFLYEVFNQVFLMFGFEKLRNRLLLIMI